MKKVKKYQEKKIVGKRDFMLPKTKIRLRTVGTRLEHRRVK